MSAAVAEPIALENGRLQAELRANLDELRGVPCATHRGRPEGNASGCNATCTPGAQQRLVALSLDFGVLETRSGGDPDANTLLAKASDKVAVSWPSCATSPAARTRRC